MNLTKRATRLRQLSRTDPDPRVRHRAGRSATPGAAAGADFRLVYLDEYDLHTQPHLAKAWQRMTVPAAGQDQRRAVFGALDYASGQVVWQMAPHKGGDAFAAFLDQVAHPWPDQDLVVVLDNVSYHRSPAVRVWWAAQQGWIIPFGLPVYTPQLNLLERVWRWLTQKLAGHRF